MRVGPTELAIMRTLDDWRVSIDGELTRFGLEGALREHGIGGAAIGSALQRLRRRGLVYQDFSSWGLTGEGRKLLEATNERGATP